MAVAVFRCSRLNEKCGATCSHSHLPRDLRLTPHRGATTHASIPHKWRTGSTTSKVPPALSADTREIEGNKASS